MVSSSGQQYFSLFDGPSTLKSISLTLLNQLASTEFPLKEYHQTPERYAYSHTLFFFAPEMAILQFVFGHFGKNACPQQLTLIGKP